MLNYLKTIIIKREANSKALNKLIKYHGLNAKITGDEFVRTHLGADIYNYLYLRNWHFARDGYNAPMAVLTQYQDSIIDDLSNKLKNNGFITFKDVKKHTAIMDTVIDLLLGSKPSNDMIDDALLSEITSTVKDIISKVNMRNNDIINAIDNIGK